jgi:hypothetical protein
MVKHFENLVKVNIQGRVYVACRTRGITDPVIVGYYRDVLEQAIVASLTNESTPADFNQVLNEQLVWLESELDQVRQQQSAPTSDEVASTGQVSASVAQPVPALERERKKATGYVPEAKAMPERLKDARSTMEYLLDNDCITLKLVTPSEAKRYKLGLLGKEPEKAEEELVTSLRNILYAQIRNFILEHDGGPWATPAMQHELRMDITRTRSLRSLVTLARELLSAREEWLVKSKRSLTGRFFGGRVKLNK